MIQTKIIKIRPRNPEKGLIIHIPFFISVLEDVIEKSLENK